MNFEIVKEIFNLLPDAYFGAEAQVGFIDKENRVFIVKKSKM